jgi:hypothetical protein
MQNMKKNMQNNMQNMQKNMSKNMQTRFQYAEYWQVYILHILHIYTLPTLLMVPLASIYLFEKYVLGTTYLDVPWLGPSTYLG